MQLKSAIFDMDGTLLDSMPAWRDLGYNILCSLGHHPEKSLYKQLETLTPMDGACYLHDTFQTKESPKEILRLMETRMHDFYFHEVKPKPGVPEFLAQLKRQGVTMYVATNTNRHLVEAALEQTGLAPFFLGAITCSEAGCGKQEGPAVYEQALERLHADKADTVLFEDAFFAIRTAKKAGFRVAGVYDAFEERHQEEIRALCDDYIRDFRQLLSPGTAD